MNKHTVHNDLIMDVGMLNGNDTLFYLNKGFRVVAIEANPELVRENTRQFATYIEQGRLQIIPFAISDHPGTATFYMNKQVPEWGTLSPQWAKRNAFLGKDSVAIEVECIQFETVLAQAGMPYYLKIDIEGADLLCVKALYHFQERPKYLSIELTNANFAQMADELNHLCRLGYQKFKLLNQLLNPTLVCPNPPLEGNYVATAFPYGSSGPFGEETPGEWLSADTIRAKIKRLAIWQQFFRPEGKFYGRLSYKLEKIWCRKFGKPAIIGWFDLHARMD